MILTRVAAPAAPLLTLQEAKDALAILHDDDDVLIQSIVASAEAYLDAQHGVLGEALVTQSWRLDLSPREIGRRIPLTLGPVQSITGIQGVVSGSAVSVAPEDYRLESGVIVLSDGASWPGVDDRSDALQITYVAGYGDTAADVPATVMALARATVVELFESRGASGAPAGAMFQAMLAAARGARGRF